MDKLEALGRPKDPIADTATCGPKDLVEELESAARFIGEEGPDNLLLLAAKHILRCHAMMIEASDLLVGSAEEIERLHSTLVEIASGNDDPYECGWYRDMAWRALREGK